MGYSWTFLPVELKSKLLEYLCGDKICKLILLCRTFRMCKGIYVRCKYAGSGDCSHPFRAIVYYLEE